MTTSNGASEVCDCEPTVYDDGSMGHEDACNIYPWCPHEVGVAACFMPCGCPCNGCQRLTRAHGSPSPSAPEEAS